MSSPTGSSQDPGAPAGWYPEPGTGRQRYWSGSEWGVYGPPEQPPSPEEGRTVMIVGYAIAGASFLIPLLCFPALALGCRTAVKRGRGAHGAAIICMSILLAVGGALLWRSVLRSSKEHERKTADVTSPRSSAPAVAPEQGATPPAQLSQSGEPFGDVAAYEWNGPVASAKASWSVPRMIGDQEGSASTYIDAREQESFISLGTDELQMNGRRYYFAFWDDAESKVNTHQLFNVRPGDEIRASLTRADTGGWRLAVRDRTSGRSAHFSANQSAEADLVTWAQEHVRKGSEELGYPQMAPVVFKGVTVNGHAPRPEELDSTWMSLPGATVAPSVLHDDSFSVRRTPVDQVERRYLAIVDRINTAQELFLEDEGRWTTATPTGEVSAACSALSGAEGDFIRSLTAHRWPARARPMIAAVVNRARGIRTALNVQHAPLTPAWEDTLQRTLVSTADSSRAARRALGLPSFGG